MYPTRALSLPLLCAAMAAVMGLPLLCAAAPDAVACRGAACEAADDAVHEMSLLSIRHRVLATEEPANETAADKTPALAAMDPESQRKRLEAAKPIAWLHVPRSGSSLGNFLLRLPGLCPGAEADHIIAGATMGRMPNQHYKTTYDPLSDGGICPGSFSHWAHLVGAGPTPTWNATYEGHCFVMLRQPEQRTLAAYAFDNFSQQSWPEPLPAANVSQYAERMQGCAVRMITRGGSDEETCGGGDEGLPTLNETALAIQRIRTGCAFVGITEEWPLSMCLGHRMFGGNCSMTDFVNGRNKSREGNRTTGFTYNYTILPRNPNIHNLTALGNFTDPYDGALYQAALEVFHENLLRYNVSMESCQPCFEEAGVEFSD